MAGRGRPRGTKNRAPTLLREVLPDELEQKENGVEQDIEQVTRDIEEIDIAKIDFNKVDISMPVDFEVRVAANQRMRLVRDANLIKWNMLANKLLNPEAYKEQEKQYNSCLIEISLLDRDHPKAKQLSKEMMELVAEEEKITHQERVLTLKNRRK